MDCWIVGKRVDVCGYVGIFGRFGFGLWMCVDTFRILDGCGSVLRLCVDNCGVLYSGQACGYLVCEFD